MKRLIIALGILAVPVLGTAQPASAALESVVYAGGRQPGSTITLSAACFGQDGDGNLVPGSLSGSWGLARETAAGSGVFENYVVAADFAITSDPIPDPIGAFRNVSATVMIPADAPLDRQYRLGGGDCNFDQSGDPGLQSFPSETFTLSATAPTTAAPTTAAPTTAAPTTAAPTTAAPTTVAPTTVAAAVTTAAQPAVAPAAPTTVRAPAALPATGPVNDRLPLVAGVVLALGLGAVGLSRRPRGHGLSGG